MARLRSAADQLPGALGVHFVHFAGQVAVEKMVSRRWASITFAGERHALTLRIEGEGAGAAADAFLDGLAEREFGLRGHILADVALSAERRESDALVRLELEALTVEAS